MKKNHILATVLALLFLGCDTEDVSQTEETIAAVNHTFRYKKDKGGDCDISVFPDLPQTLSACTTAKGVDADNSYFDNICAGGDSDVYRSGNRCRQCIFRRHGI